MLSMNIAADFRWSSSRDSFALLRHRVCGGMSGQAKRTKRVDETTASQRDGSGVTRIRYPIRFRDRGFTVA